MVNRVLTEGVYSATYSNTPVYEFQFGENNKEHVMRRREDDYVNATHILKAANLDKPGRTRILERDVQKDPKHQKIQGGYGKYQGTWIPLEAGAALAVRHGVYEKLRTIFEFDPSSYTPPPAPKHTTNKPKVPKAKPAVPKWGKPVAAPPRAHEDVYDESHLNDDESIPDDATVASASFMGEDDRYDISLHTAGGSRKRKREEDLRLQAERAHMLYGDELLDYFILTHDVDHVPIPEPPPNFQPDWAIDGHGHTALHWAGAMGDFDVLKQMKRFGARLDMPNLRGETPFMRCVLFTNCRDKQTMPAIVSQLISTIDALDGFNSTVLHHTAAITISPLKHQCARYYFDVILNKMQEMLEPDHIQRILDAQDVEGNTAVHIAAENKARKSVRALIGRGARTDIPNANNVTAEDLIQELNNARRNDRHPQASSSPFAPESNQRVAFHDALALEEQNLNRHAVSHHSEAAMSIESKIMPQFLEKFQELSRSFDDELIDKEHSEKEAKRILASTNLELAHSREQILHWSFVEQESEIDIRMAHELEELQGRVDSYLELQQEINLRAMNDNDASQLNGHDYDNASERLVLARQVNEQQNKRQRLVTGYRDALSRAGPGEKGEQYRRLISKSLDVPEKEVEMMDENLDSLIESLTEEHGGTEMEVMDGEL